MPSIAEIHNEATQAAEKAAKALYDRMGGDKMMCGFAWVTLYDVKLSTRLGKEFAAVGFRKAYGKGLELWNPSRSNVQNIDIKEEGANAYAEVFRDHGYSMYAGSRLD